MKLNGRGKASLMTTEQIDKLHGSADENLIMFLTIFRYTGERPQAVLLLEQKTCYHENGSVKNKLLFKGITRKQAGGKEAKDRTVVVRKELREALENYHRPNSVYMFPSPRKMDKPLTYHGLRYRFEQLLKKCGFEHHNFSLYSYRRTVANKLARELRTRKDLADAMGWTSLSSADPYMESDENEIEAAMQKLH